MTILFDVPLGSGCSPDPLLNDIDNSDQQWQRVVEKLQPYLQPHACQGALAQLDRFILLRVAGMGRMGCVFEAIDDSTNDRVALKIPLPSEMQTNPQLRRRFVFESDIMSRVRGSSHVVPFLGHGEIVATPSGSGLLTLPYLAMEFVNGTTLQDRLRTWKRFPHLEAIRVGMDVCRGLEHLHSQGLTHRDLKPGNLLFDPLRGGVYRLSDFGLSLPVGVQPAGLEGSLLYMAPEQQSTGQTRFESDLFSLGCILFEMVAGHEGLRHFRQIDHQSLSPFPPSLSIDPELHDLICSLTVREPSQRRPGSAKELREALERLLPRIARLGQRWDPNWPRLESQELKEAARQLAHLRLRFPREWASGEVGLLLGLAQRVEINLELYDLLARFRKDLLMILQNPSIRQLAAGTLPNALEETYPREWRKEIQSFIRLSKEVKSLMDDLETAYRFHRFDAECDRIQSMIKRFHDAALFSVPAAMTSADATRLIATLREYVTQAGWREVEVARLFELAADRLLTLKSCVDDENWLRTAMTG